MTKWFDLHYNLKTALLNSRTEQTKVRMAIVSLPTFFPVLLLE